jgi:hypothetical protein
LRIPQGQPRQRRAPAGRMRTFFLLNIRHYALPFLYKTSRGTQDSDRDGFLSIPTRLLGSLLTLDTASRPWHGREALGADRRFALHARAEAALVYSAQRVFHITQQVGLAVYVSNRQISLRRILNLIHLVRALLDYDSVPLSHYLSQLGLFSFENRLEPVYRALYCLHVHPFPCLANLVQCTKWAITKPLNNRGAIQPWRRASDHTRTK